MPISSRPLDPGIRRWLQHSFQADVGHVRVHTGPGADLVSARVGGVAASCGPDVFLSSQVDLRTDAGLHVLAHEVAHTLQAPTGSSATGSATGRLADERQAEALARLAMAGHQVHTADALSHHGEVRVLQGFNAWEHRLLGDVSTADLVLLATRRAGWEQVLAAQLNYMMLFRGGLDRVTRDQMHQALPTAIIVTLPNGLHATLGELNAVGGDFAADPLAIREIPKPLMSGILQQIRQESANRFLEMGKSPTQDFAGAITKYAGESTIGLLLETMAIDKFTAPLGKNHYNGLLARNACHFAPFAWHRWRSFHREARRLAMAAFGATDPVEKQRITNLAWLAQAYADHFIQDSFAAGHLVNKTLIMQWFTEWAASQVTLPVPDWPLVKNVTHAQQPQLMGKELYDITRLLVSNDPQTAEEQATYSARVAATRLQAGEVPVNVAYRQYLAFLDATVVQLSSNFVHNHFNENSLMVADSRNDQLFRIYGDEKLLTFGEVISRPSQAVRRSQGAVAEILQRGTTNVTDEQVLVQLPAKVQFKDRLRPLGEWHSNIFKDYCRDEIFNTSGAYLKTVLTVFNQHLGLISADQFTSGLATAWQTSLPGCGYHNVETLFDGTRAFAACNGYVYRLRVGDGAVQATNPLTGYGYHDIQLASRGGNLFVGTNGYVLALDAHTLAKKWERSLPGSGFARVNLLLGQEGRLYAGSNGHVYRLDPDHGTVLHHNALKGYGNHEIRMAEFEGILAAGTNGWVVGLRSDTIETTWQLSLKNAGWDVVDLAATSTALLAGSNGQLYTIDPTKGTITSHNSLPGQGYNWVNVASDGRTAFVGTHGGVFGFSIDGLKQVWHTPLSLAGGRVVEVLWQNGWLFAGVNGYLYQLDPASGALLYTNELKGRGFNDVTLASDGVTVYCGINGYVVGVKPDPR